MDLQFVDEYLGRPLSHDLQHAVLVHHHREDVASAFQNLRVLVVVQFLEYHEQLSRQFVQGVEELVHEVLGQLVATLQ